MINPTFLKKIKKSVDKNENDIIISDNKLIKR
jgi:hypothetical protein